MSKTLTLEIPDEAYSVVEEMAESRGSTTEKYALEIFLKNIPRKAGNIKRIEMNKALEDLMKFSGSVNSEISHSADNEQIDADLAKEYGKDL